MRSRLRIPLQEQDSDLVSSVDKVPATFRWLLGKLEQNWALSAALMLLAVVLIANI